MQSRADRAEQTELRKNTRILEKYMMLFRDLKFIKKWNTSHTTDTDNTERVNC
jgi:hypothetical protein